MFVNKVVKWVKKNMVETVVNFLCEDLTKKYFVLEILQFSYKPLLVLIVYPLNISSLAC